MVSSEQSQARCKKGSRNVLRDWYLLCADSAWLYKGYPGMFRPLPAAASVPPSGIVRDDFFRAPRALLRKFLIGDVVRLSPTVSP